MISGDIRSAGWMTSVFTLGFPSFVFVFVIRIGSPLSLVVSSVSCSFDVDLAFFGNSGDIDASALLTSIDGNVPLGVAAESIKLMGGNVDFGNRCLCFVLFWKSGKGIGKAVLLSNDGQLSCPLLGRFDSGLLVGFLEPEEGAGGARITEGEGDGFDSGSSLSSSSSDASDGREVSSADGDDLVSSVGGADDDLVSSEGGAGDDLVSSEGGAGDDLVNSEGCSESSDVSESDWGDGATPDPEAGCLVSSEDVGLPAGGATGVACAGVARSPGDAPV